MKVGQVWVAPRNGAAWKVFSRNCYETDTREGFLIQNVRGGMVFNVTADKKTGQPIPPQPEPAWFLLEEAPKDIGVGPIRCSCRLEHVIRFGCRWRPK